MAKKVKSFTVSFCGIEAPNWISGEMHFFDVICTMDDAISSLRNNEFVIWSIVRLSDGAMLAQSYQENRD